MALPIFMKSWVVTFLIFLSTSLAWSNSCLWFYTLKQHPDMPPWVVNEIQRIKADNVRVTFNIPITSLRHYSQLRYKSTGIKGEGNGVYDTLATRGFQDLVLDPGVILRLDDFMEFSAKHPDVHNPWDMRRMYSNHLGFRTVYRGMRLTQTEAQNISVDGIKSNKNRKNVSDEWQLYSINSEIAFHQGGLFRRSDLISLTDYPTLAIAVAKTMNPASGNVYLIKMNIPVLDILHNDDVFEYTRKDIAKVRVNLRTRDIDQKLESFATHHIDPSYIESVKAVSIPRQTFSTYGFQMTGDNIFKSIYNQITGR